MMIHLRKTEFAELIDNAKITMLISLIYISTSTNKCYLID